MHKVCLNTVRLGGDKLSAGIFPVITRATDLHNAVVFTNTKFGFLNQVLCAFYMGTDHSVTDWLLDRLSYEYASAVTTAVCHLQVKQGAACLGYLQQNDFCANSRHTTVASKVQ
jgi:hypothetical protein